MQVFHPCVTAIYMIMIALITVKANQPRLQARQHPIRSIYHSNLATSRLYIPGSRLTSNENRTRQHPVETHPVSTDWHCESTVQWRDLGESHYPRFVKQVLCAARQCYNNFFSCVPQYYPLTVLKLRDREVNAVEMALPLQLRNMWMFEQVQISVGCMCGE